MSSAPQPDIRMRGFQQRADVDAVLRLIDQRVGPLFAESVDLGAASLRVLADDVLSPCPVPGFDRAAMDGFALHGDETFGADSYSPLEFTVVGESLPGRPFGGVVGAGEAVRIMTGAPLPAGADAVAPAEIVAETAQGERRIARVQEAVPPGRHVGRRGEDIETGSVLLRRGRVLRPQDIGVLASVGATPVSVIRRPTAAVIVTGDELLPAGAKPEGFRIVDSNSPMLTALLQRDGVTAARVQMVRDRYELVRAALHDATEDVLLVSGGSSVGVEDHAPRVLAELGELPIHGVALRPASPTGLGFLRGRPVVLLPGNPASCLCGYDLFAGRIVRRLGGRPAEIPYAVQTLPLARKISSMVGRVDYVRVLIRQGQVEPIAVSGASILSSTTRADGFVLVPADLEGYPEGAEVRVYLYDAVSP